MPPKKPGFGHLFKADKTNKTTHSPPTEPTRYPVSGLKGIRELESMSSSVRCIRFGQFHVIKEGYLIKTDPKKPGQYECLLDESIIFIAMECVPFIFQDYFTWLTINLRSQANTRLLPLPKRFEISSDSFGIGDHLSSNYPTHKRPCPTHMKNASKTNMIS